MNYGKFINESIVINPSEISLNGKHIWNPTEEHLLQKGYKKIVETEMPVNEEIGKHYEPNYIEKEDCIEKAWKLVDNKPTIRDSLLDRIETLEEEQNNMTEAFTEVVNGYQ